MNDIEKAIEDLKQHAGRTLKTPLSEETVKLAVAALQAQAERDKMRCKNCKYSFKSQYGLSCIRLGVTSPINSREISLYNYVTETDYCSNFEPKENENG